MKTGVATALVVAWMLAVLLALVVPRPAPATVHRFGFAGSVNPVQITDPTGTLPAVVEAGTTGQSALLVQGTLGAAAGAQTCTPAQTFGVMSQVLADAGTHYFCSAYCFNGSAINQYFQVQSSSTGPLIDAGPPVAEFVIPPNQGAFFKDPAAPGCMNVGASANALNAGALSFDVSGASKWFIQDGGGSVNCNVCYQ